MTDRLCVCGETATRLVVIERDLPHHHSEVPACDPHADRMAERYLLDVLVDRVVSVPIEEAAK